MLNQSFSQIIVDNFYLKLLFTVDLKQIHRFSFKSLKETEKKIQVLLDGAGLN